MSRIAAKARQAAHEKAVSLVAQYELLMSHTGTTWAEVRDYLGGIRLPLMSDARYWHKREMTLSKFYLMHAVIQWLEQRKHGARGAQ